MFSLNILKKCQNILNSELSMCTCVYVYTHIQQICLTLDSVYTYIYNLCLCIVQDVFVQINVNQTRWTIHTNRKKKIYSGLPLYPGH